ncbi:MAG: carboxypeptidase M32 [Phototrophicaceae bacterium]|jgi:carboxypeptidase Taq
MGQKFDAFQSRITDILNLQRASGILSWDMETKMPEAAQVARGSQLETLSRVTHQMILDEETSQRLLEAADEVKDAEYDSFEASLVRIARQDLEDAVKLPTEFVAEFARLTTEGHYRWAEARAKNDFSIFQPALEKIVQMSRQKAEYLGYAQSPYDALLGEYERSLSTAQVQAIFDEHKGQLVDLVAAIKAKGDVIDPNIITQAYPLDGQKELSLWAADAIGYDFTRGRLDESVHPFSTSFSKNDARITTRYSLNWLPSSLFGTLHECGHAMYEQGIADQLEGTILGSGTSLSVHESQSRSWENMVGRSRGFWHWAFPKIADIFPDQLRGVDAETFYKAVNRVNPSFIRVEADECTYNLHIMLRFEIEQRMINGDVAVKDVPALWNELFKQYLGITPDSDANGCLQDIHWSMGGIGYFATYALGNLLGAQYFNRAKQDIPTLEDEIAKGNFTLLLRWQNENLHQYGRKFNTLELTQRVCGEGIQSRDYIAYLTGKFSDIYGL